MDCRFRFWSQRNGKMGDFTILQAPPSDGNVSVHATKAAKSLVVGVSHRLNICESKFGSRLKSLGFATLVEFVQCISF